MQLTNKEEQEYAILSVIHLWEEPIGSGTLREQVMERGIAMSEATVGRMLKEADRNGYTIRKGFQGRILTDKGYGRLCELKLRKERNTLSKELTETLQPENKKNILDALVARRAIEGEIAALAALYITPEELAELQAILDQTNPLKAGGEFPIEQDVLFHRHLARASRNPLLEKITDLIRQQFRHSPYLEHIRKKLRSNVIEDHRRILEGVKSGDPEKARTAMIAHIDGLIHDVERYWKMQQPS